MEIKSGYKQTEIGVIPMDWEVKKLNYIVESGKIPSGIYKDKRLYGSGCKIIKLGDVFRFDFFKPELAQKVQLSFKEIEAYKVQIDDIIIALASVKLEGVGKVMLIEDLDEETVYDHNVALIRLKNNYSSKYIVDLFKSNIVRKYIASKATQVGTTFLKSSTLLNLEIPLPPTLREQTAIATALSDADALITALEKLIAKKRNIKQGAMQQLLQPKEGWEVKKLGEVSDVIGGGTPSTFVSEYWNGTINWFTPTEIGNHKYTIESVRKITKEGFINSSGKILPIGSILLTTRAGIGDVSILMEEGCTNQGFQSLVAKKGYNNEYLYYLITTLKNVLIQNASGSTFLEISPNKIKQIEISISNYDEQTRIATILSDMDAELSALDQKLEKYKKIKLGMMQELLTGKTRLV
jgi:type I restriction enzyme S subunit